MNNFVSGHNFSNICDYIYAKSVKNGAGQSPIVYPLNPDFLEDGDTIYCKTDFIYELFHILNKVDKKIKIITHESDYEINSSVFNNKPKCIAKWYAINVNYEHKDLIPIPLGLANDYCNITLKFEQIQKKNMNKEKLLYINHRINTNYTERAWIYDHFKDNDWCTIEQPTLSLTEYEKQISRHKFMICPKGNGFDTHRLWECLYAGIIPIVEKHITNKNMRDLPILFVDSFKEISKDYLLNNKNNLGNNINMLHIDWWKNYIKENNE